MSDFIKGLAEVNQNEISLLFLIDGFEKIIDQHHELGFTRALLSEAMLEPQKIFSLDMCFVIEDATMCSRVLARIHVMDMGL